MIPHGSFTVTGEFTLNGKPQGSIQGFVDFGDAQDGTQCQADFLTSDMGIAGTAEVRKERVVRAAGGPDWYADATVSTPETTDLDVEWLDGSDVNSVKVLLLFIPSIVASELGAGVTPGAGSGQLCSITVMPRFMSLDGDKLVFDPERVGATSAAVIGRWVEQYLTAGGLTGRSYDKAAKQFMEVAQPSYNTLLKGTHITLTENADGTIELVQFRDDKPEFTLTFTPAAPRTISAPDAPTFFEKVREAAQNGSLVDINGGFDGPAAP